MIQAFFGAEKVFPAIFFIFCPQNTSRETKGYDRKLH